MLDMAKKDIIPSVMKYQAELAKGVIDLKAAGISEVSVQADILNSIAKLLVELKAAVAKLEDAVAKAATMEDDIPAQAKYFHDVVFAVMDEVRKPADELEQYVSEEAWPFPQYSKLLFDI